MLGGARRMETGGGVDSLSKYMGGPVLQPQYRLAVEEHCYFPAAVQDGITAYAYVLNTLKVPPEHVVLSGESASGNLVLAMLRYLLGEGKGALPLPRAVLLWSLWLDMTVEKDTVDSHPNVKTDYVFGALIACGVKRYTPAGWSSRHPYLIPLGNDFQSEIPIFLQTGTAEVLHDDHVRFAESWRKMEGK